MNYKDLMSETRLSTMFKIKENQRQFNPINVNDKYFISIQASYSHYCTPRATLPLNEYEKMEIMLYRVNGSSVTPDSLSKFEDFEIMKSRYDDYGVYGYVPVETIQKLYEWLKNQ